MNNNSNLLQSRRVKLRKYWLLFPLLLLGAGTFAQDDAIGKFFGKYIEDSRFTVVSISPKMFRLLGKANWDSIPRTLNRPSPNCIACAY